MTQAQNGSGLESRGALMDIKKKHRIFLAFTLLVTVVLTVLRYFIVIYLIEPDTGFYNGLNPTLHWIFDSVVYVLLIALFVFRYFLFRNASLKEVSSGSQFEVFASALTGFIFIAVFIMQSYSFIQTAISGYTSIIPSIISQLKSQPLLALLLVVSLPAAAYFFKTASVQTDGGEDYMDESERSRRRNIYAIFSMIPVIWLILRLLICFFDMSDIVNTPGRRYELLLLCSMLLFFLSECRFAIGRKQSSIFFASGAASVILVGISSIPNLILTSFWILQSSVLPIYYTVEIAFMVYIIARMHSQVKYGVFEQRGDIVKK